ncbi:MAG: TraR/DksA family transcriptional regulator [Castellaniella sp.]
MKLLSASVLKALETKLIQLRDTALSEVRMVETRDLRPLEEKDGEIRDPAERAEARREDEIDQAEMTLDQATARAADAALRRIANGSYGICRDCGRAISEARLFASPIALRCATCQQIHEQRGGRR